MERPRGEKHSGESVVNGTATSGRFFEIVGVGRSKGPFAGETGARNPGLREIRPPFNPSYNSNGLRLARKCGQMVLERK